VPFGWEGIGVKRYEGVFGALLLETVIECYETREVFCVGDKGRPDYYSQSFFFWLADSKLDAYLSLTR
jgi:hypothetical protein